MGQEGLRRFKLSFGARETALVYHTMDLITGTYVKAKPSAGGRMVPVFKRMPRWAARVVGQLGYRHVG